MDSGQFRPFFFFFLVFLMVHFWIHVSSLSNHLFLQIFLGFSIPYCAFKEKQRVEHSFQWEHVFCNFQVYFIFNFQVYYTSRVLL